MATANLTIRSDNGLINSPPICSMQPIVRLKQGCSYSMKIPVIDEDGDFVKCRWATSSSGVNECGDACHGLSNSILDIGICTSNPCKNRATCNDQDNRYSCTCASGFTGTNCETDIDECSSKPCQKGGTCNDQVNGYNCICTAGFTDTHCETDIDECSSNPCENEATCNDKVNGYKCTCAAGFTDTHCETDIDECASNPCENGAICNDQVNGYNCTCADGFTDTHCRTVTAWAVAFIVLASIAALLTCCCFRRNIGKCKRNDEKKKVKPQEIDVEPKPMELRWI
ncbi:fibropellin-3-like [Mytilus californianus]|uniref:fibropellin-3-like n=1 Tax=Mytilus californianus TaxID=6549 RepID=UPI002247AD56|nr:fibropellin-3-like [Mytilus californianus]